MDHASECNVEGSLLGFGENIFLELLSEMELPQDVRQFLILNKKTYKLILHPRLAGIIKSILQIRPIFIIKEAWQGSSDRNKFFHSDQQDRYCTIAIDPVITEGIVRFEVIFENTVEWRIIGIADASCSFSAGKGPWQDGNQEKTVSYRGYNGSLDHIPNGISGNQKYADGQRIAVEVDMTTVPRRATFFVEDIEQPNFVIGIPEAVRFWAFTFNKSSSFTVIKFERLIQSTAKGVKGSKALEWGKRWY
ncbi:MAG: hypothetical protein EZS28_040454 [Streblomastix strix]|uniref:B30.2/SPRY domain-containing protein n=1 Tax=Streblomastix strix TaxID=222440 RepID=A0A5J4U175_9EUKA|nr:MAG: hypothetical protein EZS28_040454 [Streblomastix strix]